MNVDFEICIFSKTYRRQELSSMFTWKTESESSRVRTRQEAVRFPTSVGPKTQVKVMTVVHKGIIEIPFTARFTNGNKKW